MMIICAVRKRGGVVHGPAKGRELLKPVDSDARLADHHRLTQFPPICWKWLATAWCNCKLSGLRHADDEHSGAELSRDAIGPSQREHLKSELNKRTDTKYPERGA
jgi:hypothetical protein